MSLWGRIVVVVAVTATLTFGLIFFIASFLRSRPATVAASRSGNEATLVLQTVAALGYGRYADWVSYLVKRPDGSWEQSTAFELPANSTIHVTIYQFDTQTGLRNPFLGKPQGLVGGTMTVDGQPVSVLDPAEAAHTFTIPDLGVSVPLKGILDSAPHQCAVAPCSTDKAHTTTEFTIRTGAPGTFRWQCFVPCAFGFLNGNGGPMQTIGFMDGYVDVV
jgi:hypothetical protein